MRHRESEARPDWHRVLSGALATGWVALAGFAGGPAALASASLGVLLPVACIWFSDALSTLTTSLPLLGGRALDRPSPPALLRFIGWVALLALTVGRVLIVAAFTPQG